MLTYELMMEVFDAICGTYDVAGGNDVGTANRRTVGNEILLQIT